MLVNFFSDERLRRSFDVSFSYRYSQEYEAGFKRRVESQSQVDATGLQLLDLESQLQRIRFRPLRVLARLVAEAFLIKFLYIALNRRRLQTFFRGRKIDLLHVNNGGYPAAPSCAAAVLAAKATGIGKTVYVVNNIAAPYSAFGRWFDRGLDRKVTAAVSRFVTGSAYARKQLKNVLGLTEEKAISIHNGIRRRPVVEPPESVRRRLGLPPGATVFGMVALHVPRKGHMVALRAWELLKSRKADSLPILAVEGTGPMQPSLQQFVQEHGLGEHIRFVGCEKNVFDFMNAMDVILLPSIANEDFPNVTLEAMSLRKPVIASSLSGVPEQVENGRTGLMVEPGNAAELAEAVEKLAENSDLRRDMGEAGGLRFEENFSASIAVEKYERLYFELLQTRAS